MRILVVEDSKLDQHRVTACLKEWHLDFTTVGDGSRGLEFTAEPYCARFGVAGLNVAWNRGTGALPKNQSPGSERNLHLHGNAHRQDKKADLLTAMAAGADDYLTKPVDTSELRAKILVGKRIIELQQSLKFAATHDFLHRR